ncbi:hypothetical protein [Bradyrhizobium sp. Ash2021]|uniref:hypothetical protein n=1 Tax=Bradyrhizobium sp. Ash2021 TaxID=2954771 RepID=UPI002816491B|nr:hypothetical protein [Bradyrhizobium sp. Ash2021]WMT78867.1 hypothetical protein NL528_22085 [Bradyrhizobium sp. Ash2021]
MADFKVIDGDGPDKEERERQQAREWAKADVERTIREVAANMLRIIRGAGKPYEILIQMKAVIDAAIKFQEVHNYWPNDVIANELHLTSKDEEYWEGEKQGRYTKEQVERWLGDGRHQQILTEHTIQRGALQAIASALIGQDMRQRAGESEFHDGLRRWAENREERLRKRREAERAAARGATSTKKKTRAKRGPKGDPSIVL